MPTGGLCAATGPWAPTHRSHTPHSAAEANLGLWLPDLTTTTCRGGALCARAPHTALTQLREGAAMVCQGAAQLDGCHGHGNTPAATIREEDKFGVNGIGFEPP